jgi:hypothetical protein
LHDLDGGLIRPAPLASGVEASSAVAVAKVGGRF